MARVVKEKASQDFSRIVKGTEKTRKKLGVLEELFTYWNLEDADDELEELEDERGSFRKQLKRSVKVAVGKIPLIGSKVRE